MTPPCPARLTVLVCGTLLVAGGCTPPDAGRPDRTSAQYLQIIALEDARPTGGDDLAALIAAAGTTHGYLRQTAVRALGRLENLELVDEIAKHLEDPAPEVRGQAAHALAQAVHRADGAAAGAHVDALSRRGAGAAVGCILGSAGEGGGIDGGRFGDWRHGIDQHESDSRCDQDAGRELQLDLVTPTHGVGCFSGR